MLKGLTSVANTTHPTLSRELHRLVQGEARDLVIQGWVKLFPPLKSTVHYAELSAPPKGSNDQRCPVDLLFEWFDQSRDVEEHQQKVLQLSSTLVDHITKDTEKCVHHFLDNV